MGVLSQILLRGQDHHQYRFLLQNRTFTFNFKLKVLSQVLAGRLSCLHVSNYCQSRWWSSLAPANWGLNLNFRFGPILGTKKRKCKSSYHIRSSLHTCCSAAASGSFRGCPNSDRFSCSKWSDGARDQRVCQHCTVKACAFPKLFPWSSVLQLDRMPLCYP